MTRTVGNVKSEALHHLEMKQKTVSSWSDGCFTAGLKHMQLLYRALQRRTGVLYNISRAQLGAALRPLEFTGWSWCINYKFVCIFLGIFCTLFFGGCTCGFRAFQLFNGVLCNAFYLVTYDITWSLALGMMLRQGRVCERRRGHVQTVARAGLS